MSYAAFSDAETLVSKHDVGLSDAECLNSRHSLELIEMTDIDCRLMEVSKLDGDLRSISNASEKEEIDQSTDYQTAHDSSFLFH